MFPSIQYVPPRDDAPALAAHVRAAAGVERRTRIQRLDRILSCGRISVRREKLGGQSGSLEAMLEPCRHNRFVVHVDPIPRGGVAARADVAARVLADRYRFRVAHEIGHTLFYDRDGDLPRRHFPIGSAAEEEFCDAFAAALLVPDEVVLDADSTGSRVFEVATMYGVSVQVAARRFADAHPRTRHIELTYEDAGVYWCQWATEGSPAVFRGATRFQVENEQHEVQGAGRVSCAVDCARGQAVAIVRG